MTIVALDIDRQTTRAAVAEKASAGVTVTATARVETDADPATLASRLRDALPGVRWGRAKLVVTAGGQQAALRVLTLPPTPEAELPPMVSLLAEREFAASERGVVDFVPLSGDEQSPRTVLAVRVRQAILDEAAKLAEQLGSSLERVTLRGCSAASAVARIDGSVAHGGVLIAAAAGDATDLIALDAGAPVVVRTAGHAVTDPQASEVRRTVSAATLQQGRKFDRVVVVGDRVSLASLASSPDKQLDTMGGAVGAALDEAAGVAPEFDLLNPRQAETDKSPRQRQLVLAGLAAALVLGGIGQAYWRLASYDREIASIDAERVAVEKQTEKFAPFAKRAEAIDTWQATNINWLDELELLARDLRPRDLKDKEFAAGADVMLTQLTATSLGGRSGAGGQISLVALAREPDTPTMLEERLRDGRREVQQGSLDQTGQRPYSWRFKPTIKILAPQKPQVEEAEQTEATAGDAAPAEDPQ